VPAQNIKVQPATIKAYGRKAQEHFDGIRNDLQIIVNAIDRAPYEGNNAAKFKNTCGDMAADFSAAFLKDMQTIANAVKATTTNIAQALGGQPISINVNGSKIVPQKVSAAADGTQSVDTIALRSLPTILNTRFDSIKSALRTHLRDLKATGWEGQGKQTAVEKVSSFTTAATKNADDAKQSIIDYINAQLEALEAADK
jgi:hypothetical protein